VCGSREKYIMRVSFYKVFFFLTGLFLAAQLKGQTETTVLDSVPVVKPKMHRPVYKYYNNGPKEISILDNAAELTKDPSTPKLNGWGSALFTTFIGLGSSSTKDGFWKVSGVISCNDTLPDWSVNLFCGGSQKKERERVRDNDGSTSVETNTTNVYNWDKGAFGVILESADTIGYFQIFRDLPEDDFLNKWSSFIFSDPGSRQNFNSKNDLFSLPNLSTGLDYEISGKFRDRNFIIIQNGINRKIWIFWDDLLAGMFQADLDYTYVTKKSRNLPYFLINREIAEQDKRDLFRLAIMSRFMNNYLSTI
jgi:hypothetical protein